MAWRDPPQFGTLVHGGFCPLERAQFLIAERGQPRPANERKREPRPRSHSHPSPSRPDRARPALPQGLAVTTSLLIYLAFDVAIAPNDSRTVQVTLCKIRGIRSRCVHGASPWPGDCPLCVDGERWLLRAGARADAPVDAPRASDRLKVPMDGSNLGNGVGCGGRLRGGGCGLNASLRAVA